MSENATELTVSIKSSDSSYKQKFLLYDRYSMAPNDPTIKQCVDEALANAKIEPEDIKVRSLLVMR